jgi:hypothetical protein
MARPAWLGTAILAAFLLLATPAGAEAARCHFPGARPTCPTPVGGASIAWRPLREFNRAVDVDWGSLPVT